jgi:hypothetical protein
MFCQCVRLQTMMPASCIRVAKGACAKTLLRASGVYYDTRRKHMQLAASTSGQTALQITPPGAKRRRTRLPVRHPRRGTRPSLSSRHQVFITIQEEYTCCLQRTQAGKQRWRSHHRGQEDKPARAMLRHTRLPVRDRRRGTRLARGRRTLARRRRECNLVNADFGRGVHASESCVFR